MNCLLTNFITMRRGLGKKYGTNRGFIYWDAEV